MCKSFTRASSEVYIDTAQNLFHDHLTPSILRKRISYLLSKRGGFIVLRKRGNHMTRGTVNYRYMVVLHCWSIKVPWQQRISSLITVAYNITWIRHKYVFHDHITAVFRKTAVSFYHKKLTFHIFFKKDGVIRLLKTFSAIFFSTSLIAAYNVRETMCAPMSSGQYTVFRVFHIV